VDHRLCGGARRQPATDRQRPPFSYSSTDNRRGAIARDLVPFRAFTSDAAGDILTDVQGGVTTAYSYNAAGRLAAFTRAGLATGAYCYNALAR
jgi:YD repeat-containing protein